MLQIENLGVRFGQKEIFSGMNLHVGRGEAVCLTGPSGCGKTTLLKAVMGFVTPYKGTISVNGIELSPRTVSHIRHLTAWMPQGLSLPSEWVREMVRTIIIPRILWWTKTPESELDRNGRNRYENY